MPRGVPRTMTVRDPEAPSVWRRFNFPTMDIASGAMNSNGDKWFAAKNTLTRPYCWTPHQPFIYGGRQFVGLYPCIAFATKDFGHIIQQGPNGLISARY